MKKFFTLVAAALCSMSMMAKDYTCPLTVSMSGTDMPIGDITVTVDEASDGTYTLKLMDFDLGGFMPVGNVVVENVEATKCGNVTMLNAQKTIQITAGTKKGDDGNDLEWMGPGLGDVNILFKGELKGDNFNAILNIPVAGELIVGVKLGDGANELGQLPNSGFENFHTAKYNKTTNDEPNGWHSFTSATGGLVGQVAGITHTWISTDVRENTDEESKNTQCVKIASAPVKVFGITMASANGTITTGRLQAGSMSASDKANCSFLDFSKTDVDGNGDPFYAVLNNKPDSINVWVKYHAGADNKNPHATISALLTNGEYAQDPEDSKYASNIIARANNSAIASTDKWQKISIPFTYDNEEEMPKAALVTMSTCNVPGGGTSSEKDPDVLYVDDVELIYNAEIKSVTMDGEDITSKFDEYGTYEIENYGKEVNLDNFTVEGIGAGCFITKKMTESESDGAVYVTLTVTSNDLKTYDVRSITINGAVTGIKNAQTITLPNGVQKIYNLAGQQVSNMVPGQVYIVKTTDGKTKKFIKK